MHPLEDLLRAVSPKSTTQGGRGTSLTRSLVPFLHLLRSDSTENEFPTSFSAHFRSLCMSARSPLVSPPFLITLSKSCFRARQLKILLFIYMVKCCLSSLSRAFVSLALERPRDTRLQIASPPQPEREKAKGAPE
jgi:hypothetical protein